MSSPELPNTADYSAAEAVMVDALRLNPRTDLGKLYAPQIQAVAEQTAGLPPSLKELAVDIERRRLHGILTIVGYMYDEMARPDSDQT